MKSEDKELIGVYLSKISKRYGEGQEINADYVRDNAFRFFRKRALELGTAKMQSLLDMDKVDEAEEIMIGYKKASHLLSPFFNPLDPKGLIDIFFELDKDSLYLPGALGEIVGKIDRNWFVGLLAPYKRGKSFFLQEIAVIALFQRFKVVFFSLEMQEKNLKERLAKRLTGFGSRTEDKEFTYPVFDCELNQNNTCSKKHRTNQISLLQEGMIPEFDPDMDYKPCDYCRKNDTFEYKMTTWFESILVNKFALTPTRKLVVGMETMYGDNLRYKAYPRFSASLSDIEVHLKSLEDAEGFIPDIIIIDYAAILKPETKEDRWQQMDTVWKRLAEMASKRHCIIFTVSQVTTAGLSKKNLELEDTAEWRGLHAHPDIFLALNQTPAEKKAKTARIALLSHRHNEVDLEKQVLILQHLGTSQFMLDSIITKGAI
jgi:hypothetical protein